MKFQRNARADGIEKYDNVRKIFFITLERTEAGTVQQSETMACGESISVRKSVGYG